MIPQEVQDLLKERNHAVIAINRPSGGPQVTPVWYLWDGEAFYFSTKKDSAKYRNMKRNPSISLIVDESHGLRYVAAYGKAHIIDHDDPDFAHLASRTISKYAPSERVEQLVLESNRVMIKLQPEKVVVRK
jgi:PPOX class probable F420-dependent enzyme